MRALILTIALLGSLASARDLNEGFIEIRPGVQLHVEHYLAKNGQPTLFLLNGLTYNTENWTELVKYLKATNPDLGIVLYDMQGQGKTLLRTRDPRVDLPIELQVQDLRDLRKALGIQGRTLVGGESYGGAIALYYAALYPDDFEVVIALAPFLERLPDQDRWVNMQVGWHNMMFPLDPRNQDELYDHYLRKLVYSTYPMAEPSLLENPYKLEAAYRMVKGAKNWNAIETAKRLPSNKLHLLAAVDDEHVKIDRINLFWNSLPTHVRESFLLMQRTRHKIPEDRPEATAAWIHQILQGNPALKQGVTFSYDPSEGAARSGEIVIPLEGEHCETLLRKTPEPRR